MLLPKASAYLHSPKQNEAKAWPLPIGTRYVLQNRQLLASHAWHGLIGAYHMSTQAAEIAPLHPSASGVTACFFWDADGDLSVVAGAVQIVCDGAVKLLSECRLQTNRLGLKQAALDGPELTPVGDGALLRMSAQFDFTFSTDAFAAQLGMLHLVQAKRFIMLENGEQITLMDSGDEDQAVLYIDKPHAAEPMAWLSAAQQLKQAKAYTVSANVAQPIPRQVQGESVANVTVLERYSTFLLQRAVTPEQEQTIWTPVFAPISWGWSIRAERRSDNEWAIMRRKVMLPTTGHDGLQLPLWNNNSLACCKALGIGV